ncbi:MAG: AraC family transcriptional regulator [Pseudoxanthomonas sp.]
MPSPLRPETESAPPAEIDVPHFERPLCEPVELRAGARMRIERVRQGAEAEPSRAFPHFHDVHEVVLFGAVGGCLVADGRRWPLHPGCVVSVPSMRLHDFALLAGPRDWILLQIDMHSAAALLQNPALSPLIDVHCALPDPATHTRLQALADWLLSLPDDDAQAPALVELLLHQLARATPLQGERLHADADALERLRPAIERLRRDPSHAPSAEQAAALCALSPAYFSRRFKQQVGMSWSDYVRAHRLHLASQRLLASDHSAAAISDALGFSSPSHFGELFLQRFGMTPAAYRRRAREANARD